MWLRVLSSDLCLGARVFWRHKGYAVAVVLTLGLGIGANTTVFSAVNGVLLRPLPFEQGDRLVLLRRAGLFGNVDTRLSVPEIADFRVRTHTLSDLAEIHTMRFSLSGRGGPLHAQVGVVSANFFTVMGIRPALGRTFITADEKPGASPVLVLSHDFWRDFQNSDSDILGRTFEMNDRILTVVGVLPPIPQYPDKNDLYILTTACPFRSDPQVTTARDLRCCYACGRLRRGASLGQARAEVAAVAKQLAREHPDVYSSPPNFAAALVEIREELVHGARQMLLILFGMVGLVLLIACSNVATLSFARLLVRQRELAVRYAVGASRWRLVSQVLAESAMLVYAGALVGLVVTLATKGVLVAFVSRLTPRAEEIKLDDRTLLFALAVATLACLTCWLLLVLRLPTAGLYDPKNWRAGGGRRECFLVVVQLAVSLIFLIIGGLLLRSLLRLETVDSGFDSESVLTVGIDLDVIHYREPKNMIYFQEELLRLVRMRPQVVSAAFASTFPLDQGGPPSLGITIDGRVQERDQPRPRVDYRAVSPGYFATLRVPIVRGRDFGETDSARELPVALISRSMAHHFWLEENPLGARISLNGGLTWRTIVGVVGNARQYGLDRAPGEDLYVPLAQAPFLNGNLLVRTAGNPMRLLPTVRDVVLGIDRHQPFSHVATLTGLRSDSLAPRRLTSVLMAIFAGLTLTTAAIGLAGLMALLVNRRVREIGIRVALGAPRSSVLWLVLRQTAAMVLLALALGLAAAQALQRLLAGLLFEVTPTDPSTYLAVSMLLAAVAGLACLAPARRALVIEPTAALRSE
jgi:putative ABC transport system permease protein